MPFEIDLERPPAGYARTSARPGEQVDVVYREFTSTEDGGHFIQRIEGAAGDILQRLPSQISPSQVDHMLAICRRDGKADVYVNELDLRLDVRAARSGEARDIFRDDIADVEALKLGVQIPNDTGILFVFSIGWRKGLFFDFGPTLPDPQPRQYDIAAVLGQMYGQVLFQERLSISDAEWGVLFSTKWFPFVGLSNEKIDALISHIRSGWDPDENLDDIVSETKNRVSQMLESWSKHPSFLPHFGLLERAVERFQNDDPVCCTALLFPRIEGILRTHHSIFDTQQPPRPENLTELAVASKIENDKCLLLPHRFAAYLRDVYFANFDPDTENIEVSRHSIAHGVANPSKFDYKSALIGILTAHQLFYFLERKHNARGANLEVPDHREPDRETLHENC